MDASNTQDTTQTANAAQTPDTPPAPPPVVDNTPPEIDNSNGLTGDVLVRLSDGTQASLASLAGATGFDALVFAKGMGVHVQHACNVEPGAVAETLYSLNLPDQPGITCGAATPFLQANGAYKRADMLVAGDILVGRFGPITLEGPLAVSTPNPPAQLYRLSVHGAGNYNIVSGPFVAAQNLNWA